jgi:ATP-binding cassette subfamily C protein LapB
MNWWRKQVIYLPQEPRFQEGSIRDNFLAVKDDLNDNDIRKLLADVGLNEIIDKTVGGLEQVISEAGTSLSLGVRRRLALARALVHGGRLVVLDEPTEGIDADGASSVYSVMNELSSSGRTLIVCSHDKEIVSGAHHTIDLDDGAKAVMRTLKN